MKSKSIIFSVVMLTLVGVSSVRAQTDEIKFDAAQPKITTVSAMRARRAPQMAAEEIMRLKLGTVVSAIARSTNKETVAGKTDYWYRVNLPNGQTGWLFGGLLLDYDSRQREQLLRRIIEDRLKAEKTEFADREEIYSLAAASIAEAKGANTRAEFELLKLLALANWAVTVPDKQRDKSPYREWHKAHDAEVIANEFGGGYNLRSELLWNLEKKYHALPIADRIAWEAAQNLQPSDCESDEICGFLSTSSVIEYLKQHPTGAHAAEAVKTMSDALTDDVLSFANDPSGDESVAQQRTELRKALTSLRLAVGKASAPEKSELLKKLAKMKK